MSIFAELIGFKKHYRLTSTCDWFAGAVVGFRISESRMNQSFIACDCESSL